jgi:hypothetical protein
MIRRTLAVVLLLLAALGVATAQPLEGSASGDPAHMQITALMRESAAMALPPRVERAFMLTLRAANDAYLQGEIPRALTLLRTFAFEVRGVKRARRLPPDVADTLIARAGEAIGALRRTR